MKGRVKISKIFPIVALLASATIHADCNKGNVYEDIDCNLTLQKTLFQQYKQQYQQLQQNDAHVAKRFDAAQSLWQKFILADCDFLNAPAETTMAGAGYELLRLDCLNTHYQTRINQLKSMNETLHQDKAEQ